MKDGVGPGLTRLQLEYVVCLTPKEASWEKGLGKPVVLRQGQAQLSKVCANRLRVGTSQYCSLVIC